MSQIYSGIVGDDGTVELQAVDLPTVQPGQQIIIVASNSIYINEFGDAILVDETSGIEMPLLPPTHEQLRKLATETGGFPAADAESYVREVRRNVVETTSEPVK